MPRGIQGHPAERIDLVDFNKIARDFTEAAVAQNTELLVLDNQSRVRRGFRVELPNQASFPGRIVVHGGDAYGPDGVRLFNEDQLNVSRTITLEGAVTTFYVEIQFTEGDGDIDGRGFWDPTVDQGADPSGDPRPDGQEFSDNVATTKVPDWKIVTPISAVAFERDTNPDSTKVPLIKITTDGTNKITLPTDKPTTTILEIITTSLLRVQDAQLFPNGSDITVGLGAASSETAVITTADAATGLVTLAGPLANPHTFGEIVKGRLVSSLDLIDVEDYGRYARYNFGGTVDYRDRLYQGDEVHGDILSEGHDITPDDQSSDVNLQAMKDHIDFLAAQIEEMKWGHRNPYKSGSDTSREPPGVANDLPSTPRYFHKAGGIQGARTNAITVGDGVESWGDFIDGSGTGIQAAITAAPVGGTIYIKRGTYALGGDVTVGKGLTLLFDTEAAVTNDGGGFDLQIPGNETLIIRGLRMSRGVGGPPTTRGLYFNTTNPGQVELSDINLNQLSIEIADSVLPLNTFVNRLMMNGGVAMSAFPLVQVTHATGQIRGTFLRCSFNNPFGLILNGACIQATTGLGLVRAKFSDCLFTTALVNFAQIAMGAASKKVTFERCEFDGLLANTTGNVVCSGGSDFRFLHCKGIGTTNRFLSLAGATDIQVDGYHNENSITVSHLRFENCSGVKISNCTLFSDSGGALTMGAIFIGSNSGTMSDVMIVNNTIEATTDNVVGVWVDVAAGGTVFRDVQINNNEINKCEVGIYFSATAGVGSIDHIGIQGNKFVDRGAGAGVASNQKVGVLVSGTVNPEYWNISSNHFVNMNPATPNLVGGAGRAAVWVFGAGSTPNFHIEGNHVVNIGDVSNPTAQDSAGFWFNFGRDLTIIGNTIETVHGDNAYGVVLAKPNHEAANCVVSNNNFFVVVTGVGGTEVFGITAHAMKNCTFAGNTFVGLNTATGTGGAIGTTSSASSTLDKVAITGNTMEGAGGVTSFVQMKAFSVVNSSILGNTVSGAIRSGVEIVSSAGGTLQVIVITGNVFSNCVNHNIHVVSNAATTRGIKIAGNTLQANTAAVSLIRIEDVQVFSISGNLGIIDDTTAGNTGIHILNGLRFKIDNNLIRMANTVNAQVAVFIGAASNFYMINNNMMDAGGNTGPIGMSDTASGATVALILDNFWDVDPTGSISAIAYGNANQLAISPGTGLLHGGLY